LFAFGRDLPPHSASAWFWWRQARKVTGSTTVKLHDLRHFYASGLIAAGCDVVTVQRALGHASATITLNTYAHLWPTAEDKTRAAAASMMAETLSAADSARTSGQR
jgi:integrase